MDKWLKAGCFLWAFFAWGMAVNAQTFLSENDYQHLKLSGEVSALNHTQYAVENTHSFKTANYLPVDSTFTLAIAPSDDGSSDSIMLPFNFCFYGNAENKV